MWDLIVSVPDHCLSFFTLSIAYKYFQNYVRGTTTTVGQERVGMDL